jgi:hypothetical protein
VGDHKLLSIYLNDHLAGSTAGLELVRRSASSNRGTPYGEFLEWLVEEIEDDRASLIGLMEQLSVGRDRLKEVAAWSFEKAGRLKPNGQLTGYSPLSRLVELEGLWVGVNGKLSLWRSLSAVADGESRLDPVRLNALEARAEEQLRRIADHRPAIARQAFGRGEAGAAA